MSRPSHATEPADLGVTALICTRDRPDMLRDAVRSLLEGTRRPDEIVIVDQSSTIDELLDCWHGSCRVRHLATSTTGLSRARNEGFRLATHDVVAILDDDMLAGRRWLAELVAGRRSDNEVVTGRVLHSDPEPGRFPVPASALVTSERPAVHRAVDASDPVPGAGLALPRRAVLDIGGYDERMGAGTPFGGAEDNDLGLRLLDAGVVVRHVPSAVSYHRGRPNRTWRWSTEWAYGAGKAAFFAKHADRPHIRRRLVSYVGRRLGRAPIRALRDPAGAFGDMVQVAGFVVGAVRWACGPARRPPDS